MLNVNEIEFIGGKLGVKVSLQGQKHILNVGVYLALILNTRSQEK